jgi:predicted branched-subunit amino acid permease
VASSQTGQVSRIYLYGLGVLPWVGWAGGTIAGALAGNILPPLVTSALGVAIYGMFIAIVVPVARQERPVALCVLIAVCLSCAFEFLPALQRIPGGFTVILCAVIASTLMALVAPVAEEVDA